MYCIGAGSEADATTTIVYAMASCSLSRATHFIAFAQLEIVAENDCADVVFLEVQRESGDLLARRRDRELQHLAGHRGRETIDARNPVFDFQDGADLTNVDVREIRRLDLLEEEFLQLAGSQDGISGHWSNRLEI